MKTYELFCILKPNLDMDEVTKALSNLEEQIEKFDGKVANVDKIGRKKLAYEIQNFRDGFYASITMNLPGDKIKELRRYIKLNESFIREMITVKEEKAVASK